jgi:hypothetical protein
MVLRWIFVLQKGLLHRCILALWEVPNESQLPSDKNGKRMLGEYEVNRYEVEQLSCCCCRRRRGCRRTFNLPDVYSIYYCIKIAMPMNPTGRHFEYGYARAHQAERSFLFQFLCLHACNSAPPCRARATSHPVGRQYKKCWRGLMHQ